ncbi:MAG: hypothetical protein RIF41_04055 [Polyangiaceae bacterium]
MIAIVVVLVALFVWFPLASRIFLTMFRDDIPLLRSQGPFVWLSHSFAQIALFWGGALVTYAFWNMRRWSVVAFGVLGLVATANGIVVTIGRGTDLSALHPGVWVAIAVANFGPVAVGALYWRRMT